MKPFQIEAWALRVIDAVKAGEPTEDSTVELKSDWPTDPGKMARLVAAHANAALGDPILWILGIDQKARAFPGVVERDLAAWWRQVESHFDGYAPAIRDVVIRHDNVTFIALSFDTDRPPYVVKVEKGQCSHEVPWRDGTHTRSARRADLLKILAPVVLAPSAELITAELAVSDSREPENGRITSTYSYWIGIYIEPSTRDPITIPYHRCSLSFSTLGGQVLAATGEGEFSCYPDGACDTARRGSGGFEILGPAAIRLHHDLTGDRLLTTYAEDLIVDLRLAVAGSDRLISITQRLSATAGRSDDDGNFCWRRERPGYNSFVNVI